MGDTVWILGISKALFTLEANFTLDFSGLKLTQQLIRKRFMYLFLMWCVAFPAGIAFTAGDWLRNPPAQLWTRPEWSTIVQQSAPYHHRPYLSQDSFSIYFWGEDEGVAQPLLSPASVEFSITMCRKIDSNESKSLVPVDSCLIGWLHITFSQEHAFEFET